VAVEMLYLERQLSGFKKKELHCGNCKDDHHDGET
jgi:hypothetical protein